MCLHLSIMKYVYIIALLLFTFVFIADYIEIYFRPKKKNKYKI